MLTPTAAFATPALSGLMANKFFSGVGPRAEPSTALFMGPPSKIKNPNPDDFATYLAKRQAAEQGTTYQPAAPAAPAQSYAPAAPAAPAPQQGGPSMGPSKIKNPNPDDFATYLAKRQAAEQGVAYQPAAPAPQSYAAPAAPAAPAPQDGGPTMGPSKIKNPNPDDFPTYLAKRKAADAGRPNDWQSFM